MHSSYKRKALFNFIFIMINKIIIIFLLQLPHNTWINVKASTFLEIDEPSQNVDEQTDFNPTSEKSQNIFQSNVSKVSNFTVNDTKKFSLDQNVKTDDNGVGVGVGVGRAAAGSRRYEFRAAALPWLESQLACWKAGGQLATPRNRHEALELGHLLVAGAPAISGTDMRDALHVGVHDIARQAAWRNLDGRLLSEAGYDLWMQGGSGSCGALVADGRYIRVDCSLELSYACESSSPQGTWGTKGYMEVDGAGLFRLHEEPLPWALALQRCESEGATLAVPATAREAGLLAGVLVTLAAAHDRLRQHGFFVGITDVAREGDWRTASGQLLEDMGYNTWAPHKPSGRRSENCGKLMADGRYADAACSAPLPYCCKLDVPKAQRGESLALGAFRLHAAQLPWFEALRACQRQNATLAVPAAGEEHQQLLTLLSNARETNEVTDTRVHVGIHDIAGTGTWKTLWGEVVLGDDPGLSLYGYGKFNRKRIKLFGSVSDCCAYMNNVGEYGNIHCAIRLPFVCQTLL